MAGEADVSPDVRDELEQTICIAEGLVSAACRELAIMKGPPPEARSDRV